MKCKSDPSRTICIYVDESRHLGLNDNVMVLGCVWLDAYHVREFTDKIRVLKSKYHITRKEELKWSRLSKSRRNYYLEVVNLFFDSDYINYRAVVIPKDKLSYESYTDAGDDFYYRMIYILIANVIKKTTYRIDEYKIFLDLKDSWSDYRAKRTAEYLRNDSHINGDAFTVQPIRSNQSVLLQLADLITGAVAAANNDGKNKVEAKNEVIKQISRLSGQDLNTQTPYSIDKMNIFKWHSEGWCDS